MDEEIRIMLSNRLDSESCSPLERFNIKMYIGLQEDPNVLQNIADEEKWMMNLIGNKLENDKFNDLINKKNEKRKNR
jgi:hypothetical protein